MGVSHHRIPADEIALNVTPTLPSSALNYAHGLLYFRYSHSEVTRGVLLSTSPVSFTLAADSQTHGSRRIFPFHMSNDNTPNSGTSGTTAEAKPTAQQRGEPMNVPIPPIGSSDPRVRLLVIRSAISFLFVCLGILTALYVSNGGNFLPAHWVALKVGVALITGIAFWTFTASSGEFTWKDWGLKLGGGAAVGAAFMILAHYITPDMSPANRIVEVPVPADARVTAIAGTGVNAVTSLQKDGRFLVEFTEGNDRGEIHLNYLGTEGTRRRLSYEVRRVGDFRTLGDTAIGPTKK